MDVCLYRIDHFINAAGEHELGHREPKPFHLIGADVGRHRKRVGIVIHSYRHRLGLAAGYSPYEDVERRLATLPPITIPAITLDGKADGVVPANDGKASASKFTGPRSHRVIANAGHNLPEEAPKDFADAAWELARR